MGRFRLGPLKGVVSDLLPAILPYRVVRASSELMVLRGAVSLTDEKITAAESLKGATMPDGQKYEDWVKGRGEENSGSQ